MFASKLNKTALLVLKEVLAVKKGQRVLIITNDKKQVEKISLAFYKATRKLKAFPTIVIQPVKTLLDYADKAVISALEAVPDVVLSISHNKLGKDEKASLNPYKTDDGREFSSIFNYLREGTKQIRAIWTPGLTVDMFCRTANVNYKLMKERCKVLSEILTQADYVHVTSLGGTDVKVDISTRKAFSDDGDFTQNGSGGNIPAGEVYISPVVGKTEGKIVFDGSISLTSKDMLVKNPVCLEIENGFITKVYSVGQNPDLPPQKNSEAKKLLDCITEAETSAIQREKEGKIPAGLGEILKKNARNIGELGIGLNPKAKIKGNMLEDEKAFRTCHFAIGQNYDGDANALIHLDCLVKNPTIVAFYKDGTSQVILSNGNLVCTK